MTDDFLARLERELIAAHQRTTPRARPVRLRLGHLGRSVSPRLAGLALLTAIVVVVVLTVARTPSNDEVERTARPAVTADLATPITIANATRDSGVATPGVRALRARRFQNVRSENWPSTVERSFVLATRSDDPTAATVASVFHISLIKTAKAKDIARQGAGARVIVVFGREHTDR